MHEVLNRILEAFSQEEARKHLDDLRGRLEEKAPKALETLEEGFYDTTAVLALPEKYRKRLHNEHAGTLHSGDPKAGEGDPHLSKHRLGLPARRGRGSPATGPVPDPR